MGHNNVLNFVMEKEFVIIVFVYAILDMILTLIAERVCNAILDVHLHPALVLRPKIVKFI